MKNDAALIDGFLDAYEPRLSNATRLLLRPLLQIHRLPKRHCLVREGEYAHRIYLIIEGASRSYYLHNGTEIHTWFAFENEVIGSLQNFMGEASRVSIELLEDSVLLGFDIEGIQQLMINNLEVTRFVHGAVVDYTQFLEDKFFDLHMKSARERYDALVQHEPDVIERVPLTYIASYIGVSRETLSRLRAQ